MNNLLEDFKNAMRAHGLTPPELIEPDKFIRFPGRDKSYGNNAGWCKLFPDYRGGVFGDFSTGLSETWFTNHTDRFNKNFSPRSLTDTLRQKYSAASEYATSLYKEAHPACPNHPYLLRKGISPHGLKQLGDELVIALYDAYGNLTSLQFIKPNGEKRFLKGGKKKGSYAIIGEITKIAYICEGWATGATIYSAMQNNGVIVGMDSKNLIAVSEAIKKKFLGTVILVCGDRDLSGIDSALKAAKILDSKGDTILPSFKDCSRKPTDFNDLMALEGLEEVKRQIEEQTKALLKL